MAPGEPPSLETEVGAEPDVDPAALEVLAADAAARAHRMLAEALSSGGLATGEEVRAERRREEVLTEEGQLTLNQDAVRLAAVARPSLEVAARLAAGTGRLPAELEVSVRAWRLGHAAGLAVLEEEWTPDPESLVRAEAALAEAWEDGEGPVLRSAGGGRWTVAGDGVQIRLGQDGRWWPYQREGDRWAPAGPGDHDPAAALADLLDAPHAAER